MSFFGTTMERPTAAQRPYRPTPGSAAQELLYRRDPVVFMSGPAGTGKSRAELEKLHIAAMKYEGMRGIIIRKTRKSITQSAMVTYEQKVLPVGSPVKFNSSSQEYRYPNGSIIAVGGMDKPSKIMSSEWDMAYVQEGTELNEEDLEMLDIRMRNGVMPYQQIIGDCNPQAPTHWLKKRADRGDLVMLESRHHDNPMLWDMARGEWTEAGKAYIERLQKLTGARKERLLYGRWAASEGLVYDAFDRKVHVVDAKTHPQLYDLSGAEPQIRIPADWPRYRVIDFGFNDPFVCTWWALDDDELYLYRELYGTQTIVEDWAIEIVRLSAGENIVATIADHDRQERETLRRHGVPTVRARKPIVAGIQAVQARLRVGANGRPRIHFLADALVRRDQALDDDRKPASTLEELDGYVWAKGPGGLITKEVPVDKDNHGLDTTRYMVAHLDLRKKDTGGDLDAWLA